MSLVFQSVCQRWRSRGSLLLLVWCVCNGSAVIISMTSAVPRLLFNPSVQFSSVTQSCPIFSTPWTTTHQASLSFTISRSWLKLMSIESVMPSNNLVLCRPLLLPSIFPSIRVFSNESAFHIRWPKYWSFNFSISPSVNIQDWFHLGLTGLIFLLSKGL